MATVTQSPPTASLDLPDPDIISINSLRTRDYAGTVGAGRSVTRRSLCLRIDNHGGQAVTTSDGPPVDEKDLAWSCSRARE